MTALSTFLRSEPDVLLAAGGFIVGVGFGAAASASNFCVMGALADWRSSGHRARLGAVALAAAVAVAGAQILDAAGFVTLSRSMYLAPQLNWAGALLGGLLFGAGMVYAGGCASRNVIRAGSGDLRGLIVLAILSAAALATISGFLAPLRAGLETATALTWDSGATPLNSLTAVVANAHLGSSAVARTIAAGLLVVPLLAFTLFAARILNSPRNLLGGLGVGALVVAGWLVTASAYDEFALRPASASSLSFVRPVADAFDWIEHSTALGLPGFGAASIFGALIGSAAASAAAGRLRLQGFANLPDLLRHLGGAVAMGIGGVLALGCSIGQGITGLSTLSLQSLLAASAIVAGALAALWHLERTL